jgi:hypothetical protein
MPQRAPAAAAACASAAACARVRACMHACCDAHACVLRRSCARCGACVPVLRRLRVHATVQASARCGVCVRALRCVRARGRGGGMCGRCRKVEARARRGPRSRLSESPACAMRMLCATVCAADGPPGGLVCVHDRRGAACCACGVGWGGGVCLPGMTVTG